MPASRPGYNLHPRYNRTILRRQKRNDRRQENTHGNTEPRTAGGKTRSELQTGRQADNDAQPGTHSPARAGDGQQLSQGSPEAPPMVSTAGHSTGRQFRAGQPCTDPRGTDSSGKPRPGPPAPAQTVSRSRCSQGRGRPDSSEMTHPTKRQQPSRSKSAPGQSVFPDQPGQENHAFPKTKKRKISFCAFLREIFKKFSFCLFLRHFAVKIQSNEPVFAPNRHKKHRPAP